MSLRAMLCRLMPPKKYVSRVIAAPQRYCPYPLGRQQCDPASHSRGTGPHLTVPSAATNQAPDLAPELRATQRQLTEASSPQPFGFRVNRGARGGNKRANDNRRRSLAWQAARPHLLHRRVIAEQLSQQRKAAAGQSLQDEFERRLSSANIFCHVCGSATRPCSEQQQSQHQVKNSVHIVHIQGTLPVSLPNLTCNCCQTVQHVQPTDIQYFPATPTQPSVWYDEQLLLLASE